MKSKLAYLVMGIAVGLSIRSFWPTSQPAAEVSAPILEETKPVQRSIIELQPHSIIDRVAEKKDTPQPAVEIVDELKTAVATAAQPKAAPEPETTRGLVINEENVAEMEGHRGELKNFGYTIKTTEGWKIEILSDDKVFRKVGLNSGDLITFESMNNQLQKPERAQLASRMVELLNSIQH